MNAHLRLVPCAVAIALMSAGCAMLPSADRPVAGAAARAPGSTSIEPALRAAQAAELHAMFLRGRQELIAGRPRAAIEYFVVVLDREPRHVQALNALAVAVAEMDRLPEAVSLLRQAVALAPQAPYLRVNLGYALYRQRDLAQARAELHVALELQPDNVQAMRNLALLDVASPAAAAVAQAAAATGSGQAAVPSRLPPTAVSGATEPVPAPAGTATVASGPLAATPQGAPTRSVADAIRPPAASGIAAGARPGQPSRPAPDSDSAPAVAKADPAAALRPEPAAAKVAQSRPSPAMASPGQRLAGQSDRGASRAPDPVVLHILGLDDSDLMQAGKPADGVQRAKAGDTDRVSGPRPVRGSGHVPGSGRRLVVQFDEGAAPGPGQAIVHASGVGCDPAQAGGPAGSVQRVRAGDADRVSGPRPARGSDLLPGLIRVRPAQPAERTPASQG